MTMDSGSGASTTVIGSQLPLDAAQILVWANQVALDWERFKAERDDAAANLELAKQELAMASANAAAGRADASAARAAQERVAQAQLALQEKQLAFEMKDADRQYGLDVQRFGLDKAAQLWTERSTMAAYNMDVARYGLDQAKFNAEQRRAEVEAKLQVLQMMADRSGPEDWVAYTRLMNGLNAPEARAEGVVDPFSVLGDMNQQYTAAPPAFPGAGSTGTSTVGDQVLGGGSPNPAAPGPETQVETGGGYRGSTVTRTGVPNPQPAPVLGGGGPMRPANSTVAGYFDGPMLSNSGRVLNEDQLVRNGWTLTNGQWTAPQPEPTSTGSQLADTGTLAGGTWFTGGDGRNWFRSTKGEVFGPDQTQFVIDNGGGEPPAPQVFKSGVVGAASNGALPDSGAVAMAQGGITNADTLLVGEEGRELVKVLGITPEGDVILHVTPNDKTQQVLGQGKVKPMASGGIAGLNATTLMQLGNPQSGQTYGNAPGSYGNDAPFTFREYDPSVLGSQPFIQKVHGERPNRPFGGFGATISNPNLGIEDFPWGLNYQTLMQLAPSEVKQLGATSGGLGLYFDDQVEQARRAAPQGMVLGATRYGR